MNGLTTPNPRSPTIRTMRSSCLASSNSSLIKAVLTWIVPEEFVLHEAHALTLDGVRDGATRPAGLERQLRHSLFNSCQVMTVQFADRPSECAPLVGQRIQIDHIFDRAKALNLVVVDNHGQVVQLMMRGEERSFPNRAFIALAIT